MRRSASSAVVDLGLDGSHFLVGDDKEVARSAGRVENPDLGDAVAQVQKLARVVARLFQLLAQIIEKSGLSTFRMFGTDV